MRPPTSASASRSPSHVGVGRDFEIHGDQTTLPREKRARLAEERIPVVRRGGLVEVLRRCFADLEVEALYDLSGLQVADHGTLDTGLKHTSVWRADTPQTHGMSCSKIIVQ